MWSTINWHRKDIFKIPVLSGDVDVVENSLIFTKCMPQGNVITHFSHYLNAIELKAELYLKIHSHHLVSNGKWDRKQVCLPFCISMYIFIIFYSNREVNFKKKS